jgi:D-beta-D-heptose 7-phosphate kinase / D-beta-D-heptose 1-phosphate adenosyltransferase
MDASVIERLAQANVLIVGDVLLDRYVEGRVSRISPEAPVPVLRHASERSLIGAAGNVAANVIVLGGRATLAGIIGEDRAAEEIVALCARLPHLRARLVRDASRPTTVKTRFLSGWHQLIRVDAEETHAMAPPIAEAILAEAVAALKETRVAILSDYAKGVLDANSIARLIAAARSAGVPVLVDPKKPDAAIFAGARLLTPNVEELAQFTGISAATDETAEAACRQILAAVAIDAILVTRGAAGMTLVERDAEALHIRAETHRVFDVTGAGDTVIATLAAALSIGAPLADAVRLANTAAGIAVTKPGTATVHPSELRRALGAAKAASVAERGEAAEQVALWKSQNLKVGFTNGCFDLLHRGHLYSLEQAARRVDRLVVAVNGDASTARLKGPGRPVQDLATRSAVLAALRFVDLVVPFDEDTPEASIKALSPDVLFKGSDYAEADLVGGEHVRANGGRVELLPLLAGHSTTGTVNRVKKINPD